MLHTPASAADQRPDAEAGTPWHTLTPDDAATVLDVDPVTGLSTAEARRRLGETGANQLDEPPAAPVWRKVLALLTEPMTVVLVIAAVISALVSHELETPLVILAVVIFNAVLNLVQERRAQDSLVALQDMTVTRARVRRDGKVTLVEAHALVPGDVVLLEAGDVVPADGRLLEAAGLEIQEAALTGEASPVGKSTAAIADPHIGTGDRVDMAFMSTEVTRGRGLLVVTTTGMGTEIGRVAGLLGSAGRETTPLQRQIAHLATLLSVIAGIVVTIVFVLGLLRGTDVADLLLTAVSLAVATIPEGLTAVVAFTLAMGAGRLARRGAIMKKLSSVETLGSTAHIATDKTGTLTLNQMTARELFAGQRLFEITGEGYRTDGRLRVTGEGAAPDVRAALLGMALASEAVVHDGALVGDPTEGALVVLAAKGGLDVEAARTSWPRTAEIPFDSDRKYMATFHRWDAIGAGAAVEPALAAWGEGLAPDERTGTRVFVKGGPDVVLGRCAWLDTPTGTVPLDAAQLERLSSLNVAIGSRGLRVMAVAQRDVPAADAALASATSTPQELEPLARDLTLLALVGIVDPPRPEAREAIALAQRAGIAVHLITGDHVGTASAIAADLGIGGRAVSGAELDALTDDELAERARTYGVVARVSPEHKIRMVDALRSDGSVVAMTGDGVNDAPALKEADIGIAMGITGTEVSKGAASMILTDDNFATIITAVREGRGIYDNVVKFVRFQIATSWGFVLIFLAAGVLGIAGGAPFSALQILWVNIIMDGPPAMALGLDRPDPDVMHRPPRPVGEKILTGSRIGRILLSAGVMAAGTLGILALAPGTEPTAGLATEAGTLAFTTFVLFQVFNLLNVRSRETTVFSRRTFTNRSLWISLGVILVLQVAVVQVPVLQGLFTTTVLDAAQWATAVAVASSVLWVEEARKVVSRTAWSRAR
ncbi:Ca2+-transporting ATPase [Sanguibacter gelidistatuariae]|uniref:Ca2+-transporting ATPase n=1 Tax=Sanguibacter gelidistatuariae TaxID=1814289 RepID=A0A1G6MNC6_9MICO|nr:cation-translocating P-type ATPase [Sanguibacter gelidistatuariae]SDC56727.1 Ca2+-transporting ATPase [Sanguibacter gelidistatuariae]